MENKKKMIFNVLFLFLVFGATLYGVFHGEDLSEIAEILKTVNLYWLLPGVADGVIQLKKNPTEENRKHFHFFR